jgi:hypothetical protein
MKHVRIRLAALLFLAFVLPGSALAAPRMWMGFQDDPSLRWREDRAHMLDRARDHNASILRTTVYWSRVAPTRPADPANPFDPGYSFDDLDEFVRGAWQRGMAVMFTIWGTPSWANGGRGPNYAPLNVRDLTSFARAVASRYSGRNPGLPFVEFYTVWNEPNLEQFLAPTFSSKGQPLAPFTYARLYRAAYQGIKAGNPRALVAIGETSPRGRDKPSPGRVQDSISPGTFARLVSTVRPRLPFVAWSHHPYSELGRGPAQPYRFPNVNLTQLRVFETKLDEWFQRKNIPIWITEYGFETTPDEPKGVSPAQQSAYLRQAYTTIRNDPRVAVFIWFIMRDDPTSAWQSGILLRDSTEKPSSNVFSNLAKLVDARNPVLTVKSGAPETRVRVPVFELAARGGAGATVFTTTRAYVNGRLVGVSQPSGQIAADGWVSLPIPVQARKGVTYVVAFDMADQYGNEVFRQATVTVL